MTTVELLIGVRLAEEIRAPPRVSAGRTSTQKQYERESAQSTISARAPHDQSSTNDCYWIKVRPLHRARALHGHRHRC